MLKTIVDKCYVYWFNCRVFCISDRPVCALTIGTLVTTQCLSRYVLSSARVVLCVEQVDVQGAVDVAAVHNVGAVMTGYV